jgi:glycosyltransferase involved in cell wall biosynthesis
MLRHVRNRGVAAARNTAIGWCRRAGVEIILMIDSDCEPTPDFISSHLRLQAEYPEAACIGGAIEGVGRGFWALFDRVMTWAHIPPVSKPGDMKHPYHLGTTNFSAKMARLPAREQVFDERLCTGEDALLIREFRRNRQRVLFTPRPVLIHHDRDTFRGTVWHHYQYGNHQYFVQLGGDLSPRCFHPLYRAAFFLAFAPVMPLYALMGSVLNLAPWIRRRPWYVAFYPLMYLMWLGKGVAILESAVRPSKVLRVPAGDTTTVEVPRPAVVRTASGG